MSSMLSRLVGSFKRSAPPSNRHRRSLDPEDDDDDDETSWIPHDHDFAERNVYSRPEFLSMSLEEEDISCDHAIRPVIRPNDRDRIPLGAGYAECINGGKSAKNEDQAAVGNFFLPHEPNGLTDDSRKMDVIEVQYFAVFDGHAGPGAALMAADQLVNHLQEKLVDVQEDLFNLRIRESYACAYVRDPSLVITVDSLVRGALEAAFVAFDEQIAQERLSFKISGGCTALVALVMLDKVYVAHAGDGRAVAFMGNEVITMATEFTPETDGERIQYLAHVNPALTHNFFSDNHFLRPLGKKDIGTRVLCRGPQRSGWHYKEVTERDVFCPPLVAGTGKWARLMGILGVTRGFGDHSLVVPGSRIQVKPFLTPVPEVRVLNLKDKTVTEDDILIMGCDGLWDMLRTEQVGATVKQSLAKSKEDKNPDRLTQVAVDLLLLARGDNAGKGWKMKDGCDASFDDITVFAIPLNRCLASQLKKSR
ncbi:protein phosphatase 1H [Aplysia californica]|uniref:Protein phosphatase 1H n=1 Tax=Aplysia californica TaxID=6500 RepID=A0ABM0JF34_APLCA|nr:protein phosphatase 1H [Aplysia californica]